MSQDIEALVREAFQALDEGGVEAMLPYVREDFEMVTPPELASEPDTYLGRDGVRRWFDSFYEAMEEIRIEPEELRSYGPELVGIAFRMVARGRTSLKQSDFGIKPISVAGVVKVKNELAIDYEIVARALD